MKYPTILAFAFTFFLKNVESTQNVAERELQGPQLNFVRNPPRSPLGLCEGDCDDDDECAGDLKCFQRNRRGQAVPGCSPGGDDDNTSDFCYREMSLAPTKSPAPTRSPTKSPSVGPSIWTTPKLMFVRNPPRSPLGVCEGDCDDDDECEGNLKCFQRERRFQPVPGCEMGGDDDNESDYCYSEDATYAPTPSPTTSPSSAPSISYAPTTTPSAPPTETPKLRFRGTDPIPPNTTDPALLLGMCEGDCDSDADCKPGLVCFTRSTSWTQVPGCTRGGDDWTAMDVCFEQFPSTTPTAYPTDNPTDSKKPTKGPTLSPTDYPEVKYIGNPATNLGLCEGDCDDDEDCQPGLMCFQRRSGREKVPGCSKTGGDVRRNFDVCYRGLPSQNPSKSPQPTAFPTTSEPTKSPKPTSKPTPNPTKEHWAFKVFIRYEWFYLKQYWRSGYYWQEQRRDLKMCAECQNSCRRGAEIEIQRCSSSDRKQRWRFYKYNRYMIESVYRPGQCAKLRSSRVKLDDCDPNDRSQLWDLDGPNEKKFEWREKRSSRSCVTNQHHPTPGEELKTMSCREAKRDETNYWTIYD